jgi:DnaJ like chaperone protein
VVLGVSQAAPFDEIRQAYRRRMSQYHPDKVATLGDELQALALRKTQAIEAAFRQAQTERN